MNDISTNVTIYRRFSCFQQVSSERRYIACEICKHTVHSLLVHFLRFSATDDNSGVAAADVSVNLCDCSGHGECRFDRFVDGFKLKDTFRIVECNCSIGWEGEIYEDI